MGTRDSWYLLVLGHAIANDEDGGEKFGGGGQTWDWGGRQGCLSTGPDNAMNDCGQERETHCGILDSGPRKHYPTGSFIEALHGRLHSTF